MYKRQAANDCIQIKITQSNRTLRNHLCELCTFKNVRTVNHRYRHAQEQLTTIVMHLCTNLDTNIFIQSGDIDI